MEFPLFKKAKQYQAMTDVEKVELEKALSFIGTKGIFLDKPDIVDCKELADLFDWESSPQRTGYWFDVFNQLKTRKIAKSVDKEEIKPTIVKKHPNVMDEILLEEDVKAFKKVMQAAPEKVLINGQIDLASPELRNCEKFNDLNLSVQERIDFHRKYLGVIVKGVEYNLTSMINGWPIVPYKCFVKQATPKIMRIYSTLPAEDRMRLRIAVHPMFGAVEWGGENIDRLLTWGRCPFGLAYWSHLHHTTREQ